MPSFLLRLLQLSRELNEISPTFQTWFYYHEREIVTEETDDDALSVVIPGHCVHGPIVIYS